MHDIIRGYLHEQTRHRRQSWTGRCAHRGLVPDEGGTSAWWQLPADQAYPRRAHMSL